MVTKTHTQYNIFLTLEKASSVVFSRSDCRRMLLSCSQPSVFAINSWQRTMIHRRPVFRFSKTWGLRPEKFEEVWSKDLSHDFQQCMIHLTSVL